MICFVYRWLRTLIESSKACPLCEMEFYIPNPEETEPSNEAIMAQIAEVGFQYHFINLRCFQ